MKKILDGQLPIPNGGQTNTSIAGMNLALSNLTLDITEYLRWTRTDVTAVGANHWLVNYLLIATGKLGYRHELSPQESFNRTDFATEELARAFGFTSESNAGRLHIGDNGAVTIYVIGKSPRRKQVNQNTPYWEMVPMRYLSHGSTSLAMGNHAEPEDGIGCGIQVIELDLSLLHYQAIQFMNYWYTKSPDNPRSLQQMVSMNVLARLKLSQYDIASMNRMMAKAKGLPVNNLPVRLSKSFPDRHPEMDRVLTAHTQFLLGQELSFEGAIAALDFPLKNNPFKVLSFDDYSYSRAITWALLIARFGLVDYLFAICRVTKERSGKWPVNDIKRTITRISNDSGFNQALSYSERSAVREHIDSILKQIN